MNRRFKVGDRVRLRKTIKCSKFCGFDGHVVNIADGFVRVLFDNNLRDGFKERQLALVSRPKNSVDIVFDEDLFWDESLVRGINLGVNSDKN